MSEVSFWCRDGEARSPPVRYKHQKCVLLGNRCLMSVQISFLHLLLLLVKRFQSVQLNYIQNILGIEQVEFTGWRTEILF